LNGHHNLCTQNPKKPENQKSHHFIIISHREYNAVSDTYLAVPIKTENTDFSQRFACACPIVPEDDLEWGKLTGFVRIDCVCRINKSHVEGGVEGKFNEPGFNKLLNRIDQFMKTPNTF
jgi:hypothetical protein